jgi:hypothetical protein
MIANMKSFSSALKTSSRPYSSRQGLIRDGGSQAFTPPPKPTQSDYDLAKSLGKTVFWSTRYGTKIV